jgi:hypothetical protein
METSLETAALEAVVSVDTSLDTTVLETMRFRVNPLVNHRIVNHSCSLRNSGFRAYLAA